MNGEMLGDSTLVLYNEYSLWYGVFMARFRKLAESLSKQIEEDSRALNEWNKEREQLRSAAMRFAELADLARPREERLEIIAALIFNRMESEKRGSKTIVDSDEDDFEGTSIPVSTDRLDLSLYPLWKIIREIVRQTGEIQVVRLERVLRDFALKFAGRQSIESALATHRKDFRIVKRGREKFVSLK